MNKGLYCLNTFEIEVVRSFVAELKDKLGNEIVKILLFGSILYPSVPWFRCAGVIITNLLEIDHAK